MTTPTGILFFDPRAKPLSTSGLQQAGAYLLFYLTGTTTSAPVYADGALTTPLSQTPGTSQPSCTADSAGRFNPIYMDPSVVYRVQLYTAGGSTLEDTDPYLPAQQLTAQIIGLQLNKLTAAEISASITPTNYGYRPGVPDRYGNNTTPGTTDMSAAFTSAAAQAAVAGGAPVTIDDIYRISSNVVIPKGATMVGVSGSISIDSGKTLTFGTAGIGGFFTAPRIPVFTGSGTVIFGQGAATALFPEWFGAVSDGVLAVTPSLPTGTDNTVAIQSCILASTQGGLGLVSIIPISLGTGSYLCANLFIPVACRIFGTGRQNCALICASTATAAPHITDGKYASGAWTSSGSSASKIILEYFAMYGCQNALVTDGIKLGFNTTVHGTEGYLRGLWVRDYAAGNGINVKGNVAWYKLNSVYFCTTNIAISGNNNKLSESASVGATTCAINLSGIVTGDSLEIEAPVTGCIPLFIQGNTDLKGVLISLAAGETLDHLWELGASATVWSIEGLAIESTSTSVVTNGNGKRADGTFFGGNASNASSNAPGTGNYASDSQGQTLQSFTLRITNTGGSQMQHRIAEPGGTPTQGAGLINDQTSTLENTPTGTDATTAMASGGKISTTASNSFILDTPPQVALYSMFLAAVTVNSSTTDVTVVAELAGVDVNGVTQPRLTFYFYKTSDGSAFALSTGNIASGKLIDVVFYGYLSQ